MNLFQYLFSGTEGRTRLYILLFFFVLATGSTYYVANEEDVNHFFTSLFSSKDETVSSIGLNTWSGFSPVVTANSSKATSKTVWTPNDNQISSKDCIVLDKCNTVDKEFYFILKHPNGKTSRVQVTEKEYLNTYRGEVFNEPKPSSSDQKMAVIMTVSESKVNDMLISKGK